MTESDFMNERSEMELVAQARAGDVEALSEVFRRHYASSIAVARRHLGEEDSLDAVQSAYLSAFRKFTSYRGESSFKTWLTRIVINQCLLHFRNPACNPRMTRLHGPESTEALRILVDRALGPEELVLRAEVRNALLVALSALPKRYSDVFNLYNIAGLSVRDTAAKLGITVAATKTRLHRAKSRMRNALRAVGEEFACGASLAETERAEVRPAKEDRMRRFQARTSRRRDAE